MARCSGIQGDGSRCEGIAKAGESYCYAHDPERAEERRRNASRGAAQVATNAGSDRGHPSSCGSTVYPQSRGALPR